MFKDQVMMPVCQCYESHNVMPTYVLLASTCTTADGERLFRELQFARCMSNRYRNYNATRCVSCTRRWAGDTCRFQGIRYFLRNEHSEVVAMTFNENRMSNEISTMDFPKQWNRKIEREHTRRSKVSPER